MIIFEESSLGALNGDEVLAIAASINGGVPSVSDARSYLLVELGGKLADCDSLIDELIEEGKITPEEGEAGRPTSEAEVALLRATIEKVKTLSDIDCTYLLGLVSGFMSGLMPQPLAQQWDNGRLAAAAMNR